MKKYLFSILLSMLFITGKAQLTETFDSNSWGWAEYSGNKGDAVIMNGVLHMESKQDVNSIQDILNGIFSVAYAPLDTSKGFLLTFDASINKVDYDKTFGIVLDYSDDWNCIILLIKRDNAYYYQLREGRVVGSMHRQFKFGKQKKASVDISVKYIDSKLELRVNDVFALEKRNVIINNSGIGFFAYGKVKVDFDNVTVSDLF